MFPSPLEGDRPTTDTERPAKRSHPMESRYSQHSDVCHGLPEGFFHNHAHENVWPLEQWILYRIRLNLNKPTVRSYSVYMQQEANPDTFAVSSI